MERIADSTIKGFMYQFNLSLNEILKSTNEIIKIEGIIEDIDRINEENTTAIQCKYHEEVEKFQWSKVSKPILQMLKTYTNSDGNNISFILYAFFPSEQFGEKAVPKNEINEMLNTRNIEYICNYISYIKKIDDSGIKLLVSKERKTKEEKEKIQQYFITNELEVLCDLDDFLDNRFRFVVGREYYELEEENKSLLCQNGFSQADVNDIVFPNAIQKIASLSILKEDKDRNITKKELLEELKSIRKTAISRWTRELSNYKELLSIRRKQLGKNLNVNYRKRCFVFELLMLSWAVMISLCHADMRLPGYLSWNVSFDGADLSAPSRKELVHTSMLCQHFKRRDDGTGICLFHSAVMPEAFLIPEEICQ